MLLEVSNVDILRWDLLSWILYSPPCPMALHAAAKPWKHMSLWLNSLFSHSSTLLLFSLSVMSDSLRTHGLQDSWLPCPSPSPGVCSNSCPLSQWCHPTISASVTSFFSCPQSFPASVFSNELALCVRWPKYWNWNSAAASVLSVNIQGVPLISTKGIWLLFNF